MSWEKRKRKTFVFLLCRGTGTKLDTTRVWTCTNTFVTFTTFTTIAAFAHTEARYSSLIYFPLLFLLGCISSFYPPPYPMLFNLFVLSNGSTEKTIGRHTPCCSQVRIIIVDLWLWLWRVARVSRIEEEEAEE